LYRRLQQLVAAKETSSMATRYPPGPTINLVRAIRSQIGSQPKKGLLTLLLEMAQTYGDIVCYKVGPLRVYSMNHPDPIREVLSEYADKFEKGDLIKRSTGRLLGNGLFTNDGESWKRQRKLVQPAFHHQRIAAYADVMVNYSLDMLESWQGCDTRDLMDDMMALTMRVVARTLFDADLSGETNRIGEAVSTIVDTVTRKFGSVVPIPEWLPTAANRQEKQAIATMDGIIANLIAGHRASGEDRGDLLSMLLRAQDEDGSQMTDSQLRDEVMTLLISGHETTAIAATWIWYFLSQHPEVEAKLHDELEVVLGGRTPTMHNLAHLPYTDMIVKETLRLYPPATLLPRQASEDVVIGGYTLKKGSTVFISPYVVHHDPRWYPEPERFLPERWANDFEKSIPHYAYLPFGGGPRFCIGTNFAMMEIRLVLATIAQRYRLAVAPGEDVRPGAMLTLRPQNGLRMMLHPRTAAVNVERRKPVAENALG
jgi:cytochrome P450